MASQVQIPFEGVILQEHSAPISCPTPNFAKGSVPYWACFEGMGEQTALGALWLVFFPLSAHMLPRMVFRLRSSVTSTR